MDQLLRRAMAAPVPGLSPGFDARVMQRLRPRRLTWTGGVVLAAYAVAALGTTMWVMRDLQVAWVAAAVAGGMAVAAGASAYVRAIAAGR